MSDILETSTATPAAEAGSGHACGCGGGGCGGGGGAQTVSADSLLAGAPSAIPSLTTAPLDTDIDVRAIPHEVRHARVIGMVTSLVPGESVVIAAPHDPARLVNEIEAEVAGDFQVDYLQAGPELWRVAVSRVSCC
jgi:uncharacterized protein (DUF2249 family)